MIGYIIVIFVLSVVFIGVPLGLILMFTSFIYNRRERDLRNEAEAHRKILESTYDHIWREIKQHCGLTEEHRRSFNNVYPNPTWTTTPCSTGFSTTTSTSTLPSTR